MVRVIYIHLPQLSTSIRDVIYYDVCVIRGLANIRAIEEAKNFNNVSSHGLSNTSMHSRDTSKKGVGFMSPPPSSSNNHSKSPLTKSRYRSTSVVNVAHDVLIPYAVNAIDGLMRALTLGTKRWSSTVTEDMLNIMLLWFRYGHIPEVG